MFAVAGGILLAVFVLAFLPEILDILAGVLPVLVSLFVELVQWLIWVLMAIGAIAFVIALGENKADYILATIAAAILAVLGVVQFRFHRWKVEWKRKTPSEL